MTFIYLSDKIHYADKILKGIAFMKKPLILAISAVAVVTVLASPRLGFSANCTAPVISRPSNQAASYEPQFRYSPGDNLRLTDNLGETSFPEKLQSSQLFRRDNQFELGRSGNPTRPLAYPIQTDRRKLDQRRNNLAQQLLYCNRAFRKYIVRFHSLR